MQPYGRVNFFLASPARDVARFIDGASGVNLVSRSGTRSAEVAAGLTWQLRPSVSVYGEIGRMWSMSGAARTGSGVQGALGLKVMW